MQYIGPDYDAANGIILPGLSNVLFPRNMTSGQITELLAIFPHLQPYFGTGTNDNGGGGGNGGNNGTGQFVPLAWWDVTPTSLAAFLDAASNELGII